MTTELDLHYSAFVELQVAEATRMIDEAVALEPDPAVRVAYARQRSAVLARLATQIRMLAAAQAMERSGCRTH